MEWDKKFEMVRFFNIGEQEKAIDIVLNNLDMIDEQGWEMFFTALELTKENINKYLDKHKIIQQKTESLQSDNFRIAMRLALYDQLVSIS